MGFLKTCSFILFSGASAIWTCYASNESTDLFSVGNTTLRDQIKNGFDFGSSTFPKYNFSKKQIELLTDPKNYKKPGIGFQDHGNRNFDAFLRYENITSIGAEISIMEPLKLFLDQFYESPMVQNAIKKPNSGKQLLVRISRNPGLVYKRPHIHAGKDLKNREIALDNPYAQNSIREILVASLYRSGLEGKCKEVTTQVYKMPLGPIIHEQSNELSTTFEYASYLKSHPPNSFNTLDTLNPHSGPSFDKMSECRERILVQVFVSGKNLEERILPMINAAGRKKEEL